MRILLMLKKQVVFITIVLFCAFSANAQDTIPFSLGADNRIYIKVTVNNSEPLDFIFDTGASSMVANTSLIHKKVALRFDDEIENRGANGVTKNAVSNGNTLRIGKFKRADEQLLAIEYPEKYYSFDGVIGYPFFEDYLIEINYKKEYMVIHEDYASLAEKESYETMDVDMSEDVPFANLSIFKANTPATVPVMLDTGYDGALIIYNKMVVKHALANAFTKTGSSSSEGTDGTVIRSDMVLIPKTTLGSIEFADLPANLNLTPATTSFTGIMGGQIMREVHWVFDFQKEEVLFKVD